MHNGGAEFVAAGYNGACLIATDRLAHHSHNPFQNSKTPSTKQSIAALLTTSTGHLIASHAQRSIAKPVAPSKGSPRYQSFLKIAHKTTTTKTITKLAATSIVTRRQSINSNAREKRKKNWCHICRVDCEYIIYCSSIRKEQARCRLQCG